MEALAAAVALGGSLRCRVQAVLGGAAATVATSSANADGASQQYVHLDASLELRLLDVVSSTTHESATLCCPCLRATDLYPHYHTIT